MDSSKLFSLTPGRPFSLWLDPARWPVSPLRLPGKGFSLWQDPARWPVSPLRLPGKGFSLWQDPAVWPVSPLRLGGKAFTLWLDPARWPVPSAATALQIPLSAEQAGPLDSFAVLSEKLETLSEPVMAIEQPETTPAVKEIPPPPVLVTLSVPEVKPLSISQNKAFTLWTRPAQVVSIPMQNGLTAVQTAAVADASSALLSGRSGAKVVVPAAALAPLAHPVVHPVAPPSLAERWLPLAAAVVAVFGLNALVNVANEKKSVVSEAEVSLLRTQLGNASKNMDGLKATLATDTLSFMDKSAAMQANLKALEERNTQLVKELTAVTETSRKSAAQVMEQESKIQSLSGDLVRATNAAATASNEAGKMVVKIAAEASLSKRESGAALVALQEALAKAEAEKAAAFKAAAEATAALSALRSKTEATPKPTP